jgi:rod shape-determining protein MreD
MKSFVFILVIIMLAILQVTILDIVKIFNNKPDFLLICVVVASLFFEPKQALIASVFAGILKDIFYTAPFGINTVLFLVWSLLIAGLSKKISIDYYLIRMSLMFIISLLNNVVTGLIISYLGNFIPLGIFFRNVILSAIYTTIAFFPFLKISEKFPAVFQSEY